MILLLDEFCNKLPEATQVALALRLIEVALPLPVLKDYPATFIKPLTLEKWEMFFILKEGEPPLSSPC